MTSDASLVDLCAPRHSNELVGNADAINAIRSYFTTFTAYRKRTDKQKTLGTKWILVYGPPGVGKTTCVRLLAQEFGYEVREFNGSDTRRKADLEKEVFPILCNNTLPFCKPPALVIEEADGLCTEHDGNTYGTIGKLLQRHTEFPIVPVVFVANDLNKNLNSMTFKNDNVKVIPFVKPSNEAVAKRLTACFSALGLAAPLKEVIDGCNGDLRKALNAHHFWLTQQVQGDAKEVHADIARSVQADKQFKDASDAFRQLFLPSSTFDQLMISFEQDPFAMPSWLHENALYGLTEAQRQYQVDVEIARCTPITNAFSVGDVFQTKFLEDAAGAAFAVTSTKAAALLWGYSKDKALKAQNRSSNSIPPLGQLYLNRKIPVRFPQASMNASKVFRETNAALRGLSRAFGHSGNAALDGRDLVYDKRKQLIYLMQKDAQTGSFDQTVSWLHRHKLRPVDAQMLFALPVPIGQRTPANWRPPEPKMKALFRAMTNERITKAEMNKKRKAVHELADKRPSHRPPQPPPPPQPARSISAATTGPTTTPNPGVYMGIWGAALQRRS